MSDIVERLFADASQLRKCVKLAAFGGEETGVRVKSPELLLADIDEASAVITALRAQVESLTRERDDARAEVKRWSDNWNANVAEMSQRFRAVNIERVIEATGQDIFALVARATAAEQEAERLRAALSDIAGSNAVMNALEPQWAKRFAIAALSEKSDG